MSAVAMSFFTLFLPLISVVLLYLCRGLASLLARRSCGRCKCREWLTPDGLFRDPGKYVRTVIGLALSSFTNLTTQVADTFNCVDAGPVRVVYSSPGIWCNSDGYSALKGISI